MLDAFGWMWKHDRPGWSRGKWSTPLAGYPGFPDIVALKGQRLLVRELKTERGRTTELQEAWLEAWATVGADVDIWRPSDLSSGRVERILRGSETGVARQRGE